MMNRQWNVAHDRSAPPSRQRRFGVPRRSSRASCASGGGKALADCVLATGLLAAWVVAFSVHARATVLVGADLGDLSRDAIAIARGRIAAVTPQWSDDRRTIETLVTLDVDEYLKGALGASVQFRVPGGDLGRLRTLVVGAPEFEVDEQVIVFLGARGPTVPYVLGLNQGVYRLVPVTDRSEWLVMPPAILPSASTGNVRIVRGDTARRALPLDTFERHVRDLAGGAR
jgi:hypothetical protein